MATQTTHRILIGWLILALLLAQGLRVCIHAYDAPHSAEHAHDVAATHVESLFSVLDSHDEEMSDTHITLFGILKHLSAQPLVAVLFIALLILLLPRGMGWFIKTRDRVFRPPHGHYFSPPLRAPPR